MGRLLHVAASPHHIACASASGEVRVYSAASLDEVTTLACPDALATQALSPAAVSCAFSPDGATLTALFSNGRLCSWECGSMAEVRLAW